MTKTEFEVRYATKSGMTVERLHELGLSAYPCDCNYEECTGWQMLHKESPELTDPEHPNNLKRIEERTMTNEEVIGVLGEPPSSRSVSDRDRKTTRCRTPVSTS